METLEIRRALEAMSQRTGQLVSALSERKRRELEFHNVSKGSREKPGALAPDVFEKLHGNKKYYAVVGRSRDYVREWIIRHAPGRVFLDYACGNGEQAIAAARAGSALSIGIDLSDVSLANARRQAHAAGVDDRCVFVQADCEDTRLPSECVDVVLCSGMLHHLDLSYALPELRRIVRPGGRVLAMEALDYNPVIKLYRRLTPSMRTEWEKDHILSLDDVRFARCFFDLGEVRYWHLLALGATFLRGRPSLFARALAAFDRVDSVILRIPGLRLMAWNFTFELTKRREE